MGALGGGGGVGYLEQTNAPINVMPGGWGPEDRRVGTLIRNKNLESNFNPWDKISMQSSPR